jgi:hypothetical protein
MMRTARSVTVRFSNEILLMVMKLNALVRYINFVYQFVEDFLNLMFSLI